MGEAAVIWGRLTEAFWLNCQLFGLTLLFALPLGLVVSFGSMSKFAPLRGVVKTFVWIIRGTPLMLQILVIYLGAGPDGLYQPLAVGRQRPPGGGRWWRLPSITPAIFRKFTAAASRAVPKGQTGGRAGAGHDQARRSSSSVTLLQVIKRIRAADGQ